MPYEIDSKLVVAVASSALFDLTVSDAIYVNEGKEAYREYQRKHENDLLDTGVAFPFIRRLLSLNDGLEGNPVEVILLSRNDCDTGLRVMKSIEACHLGISRGVFLSGGNPYLYVPAFGCCLFLSANAGDVRMAIQSGSPAGMVMESSFVDDRTDDERESLSISTVCSRTIRPSASTKRPEILGNTTTRNATMRPFR